MRVQSEASARIATLPNLITLIRLVLVPCFAIALLGYQNSGLAFALFLIAAATDFVDGAVARATGQVSKLGQQMDPLVDRALIITAVICVFMLGRVPVWILLALLARDLTLLVLLVQMRAAGQPDFKVIFVGKAATACNMVGFSLLILGWPELGGLAVFESTVLPGWGAEDALLGIWFLYPGVLLAWIAGACYLLRAYRTALDNSATGARLKKRTALTQDEYVPATDGVRRVSTHQSAGFAATDRWGKSDKEGKRGKGGKSPTRLLALALLGVLFVLTLGYYCYDGVYNFGVIHSGVRVGVLDTGRLSEAEAAALLQSELDSRANAAPVYLFADDGAQAAGADEHTQQLGGGVGAYAQREIDQSARSWSVDLAALDARIDGTALAARAYSVGRGSDFLLGRPVATFLGVEISPAIAFSEERLRSTEELLTEALGIPLVNASVSFDGSSFVAHDGRDGYVVDEERFRTLLTQAFLSKERELVVPFTQRAMQVNLDSAQKSAQALQNALAQPLSVSYNGQSWRLPASLLGQLVVTQVERGTDGHWQLVPRIDTELLRLKLPEIIGQTGSQVAPVSAYFTEVNGRLVLQAGVDGAGVDYPRLAADLTEALFGANASVASMVGSAAVSAQGSAAGFTQGSATGTAQNAAANPVASSTSSNEASATGATSAGSTASSTTALREIPLHIGTLEPALTTAQAEAYGFKEKIGQFTIDYAGVGLGTVTNIHVASSLINSSIIAPQGIWSFNQTAGECTVEKGFVEAQVILGNEYSDEIGGGVCNVASTVFNVVYEAGYPLVERTNHSLRLTRYPPGRDAAIAYPWADLKFQNDTDHYLLLTLSCTDTTVTATLWGTPPGYVVVSEAGELVEGIDFNKREVLNEDLAPGRSKLKQEGKKASKIEVTRTVYYADGTQKERHTFYSSYDPTTEVTEVGPKIEEPAEPEAPEEPATPGLP